MKSKTLFMICVVMLIATFSACGDRNIFDCASAISGVPCSERTKDEEARIALDNGDLEKAVELLRELVDGDPENYSRYPLLAAALAGLSGFDVFNIASANLSGGSTLLASMGSFLPTPASKGIEGFEDSLENMSASVTVLQSVPEGLRADVSGDKFAASCALQLMLYQTAYSMMLINKYSYSADGYDPSKLASMSEAEALAVLEALLSAGQVVVGQGGEKTSAAVQSAYDSIQNQEGATTSEKIASYVAASH